MDNESTSALPGETSQPLSMRAASVLLVITMVLVITVGSFAQARSLGWGLLITEFVVILAPALVFVRLKRLSIREALRLNRPPAPILLVSLIMGAGAMLFAAWWGGVVSELLGYTLPLPPEFYPRTWGPALLLMLSVTIAAPLCEEALFRGAVQHAYERRGPWFAILSVGLLFAVYHASLLRFFALLPVALLLGYVAWRTGSLWPGVALHLGYNAIGSIPSTVDLIHPNSNLSSIIYIPGAPLVGLLVVLSGVLILQRTPLVRPTRTPPPQRSLLGQTWLLLILIPIVLFLYGTEVVIGRAPELLAVSRITLKPAPWTESARLHYVIYNPLDEPVGSAVAEITPDEHGDYVRLRLKAQRDAFEAQLPGSYYSLAEQRIDLTADWFWKIGLLEGAEGTWREGDQTYTLAIEGGQASLAMEVSSGGKPDTVPLPGDVLLAAEWPWRLSALSFDQPLAVWRATLAQPYRFAEQEADRGAGADDTEVILYGSDLISVPAGRFVAWVVRVNDQTAWYDIDAPHTLLQYSDGIVSYRLESTE